MDNYLDGQKAWSQILEQAIKSARLWRLSTVIALVVALVACVGMVIVTSRSSIQPVLVVLSKDFIPIGVGGSSDLPADSDILTKSMLAKVVRYMRTVSVDKTVQQNYLQYLSQFMRRSTRGHNKVMEMLTISETNPFQRALHVSVDVSIQIMLRQSENTWQVEWIETTRDMNGNVTDTARFRGNFIYAIATDITKESLLVNPIGFSVVDFNITQI